MKLPRQVRACMDALESRGYEAWAVGGCVRDHLLGKIPQDFDLCTNALPEQIREVFRESRLVLAGIRHGTVGVVTEEGLVEITTFRTEGGYSDSRHPDWVHFVPNIEEDLARRDFTVNAMAWSPSRGLRDPFGGERDLEAGILRAVGTPEQRFREDALRILRGVRFSVRFGLTPDAQTENAMMTLAPLLDKLARERVFGELCKLLPQVKADDLLRFAPVLGAAIPELDATRGFQQHSPHHRYDIYTHTAYVTGAVPGDLALRWAALLHDVGKVPTFTRDETGRGHFYGHAQESARMAGEILGRLRAPTALREQAVTLISLHMTPLVPDRKLLRRRLSRYGFETVLKLLQLQMGDFCSKGVVGEHPDFDAVAALLDRIEKENACLTLSELAVNGHDLMALGYAGPAIGACLKELLLAVVDERLPNHRQALLEAAQKSI